jgi:integrase
MTCCDSTTEYKHESTTDLSAKIDLITRDASKPYFNKCLKRLSQTNHINAQTICDYIIAEQTEINIKRSTAEGKIKVLVWLSNFHGVKKFKEMDKSDILKFLNGLRKSDTEDPIHKWIGTYNGRQMILNKFFRWLYSANEADQKKRITPACMLGVKKLPTKAKSPYKHTDMWYPKEYAIFLKYCPDTRDRCYHAIAIDTSARPHEILNLKISDIKFNVTEDHIQYAEVRINEGKTGPRTVPLIDSIPYLKEWLSDHPAGTNNNSWLFVSRGNSNIGQKLTYDGIVDRYSYYYKTKFFPNLLQDKTVPEEDKEVIKSMLLKPWNLYVFRHSALTEKSQILPEAILRSHAGWTMSSKMPQIYIHLSGESSKILLEKRGILMSSDKNREGLLKSKYCPNCYESNRPDSKFCLKCKMVLKFDAYKETLESEKNKEQRLSLVEHKLGSIESTIHSLVTILDILKNREEINSFASKLYSSGILKVSKQHGVSNIT